MQECLPVQHFVEIPAVRKTLCLQECFEAADHGRLEGHLPEHGNGGLPWFAHRIRDAELVLYSNSLSFRWFVHLEPQSIDDDPLIVNVHLVSAGCRVITGHYGARDKILIQGIYSPVTTTHVYRVIGAYAGRGIHRAAGCVFPYFAPIPQGIYFSPYLLLRLL